MKRIFSPLGALLAGQFLSAFVDNTLLFIAQAIIRRDGYPDFYLPLVQGLYLAAYILASPWVGGFSDFVPKAKVLLIGNLVAFILCVRGSLRLSLTDRGWLTPTIQELVFTVDDRLRFEAGQYLELEVPHPHPDSRGTRRPFSIVSAPEDLPRLRIAYRDGAQPRSSFKTALADVERGGLLHATGVWGDFLLPADARRPILLLAGGIGITPFISQLRHLAASGQTRDIVLVYVVSDPAIAFRDEIAATGIATVVFAQQAPDELPAGWTLAPSARIDGESLLAAVPDLSSRDAYVSGPPRLIADLTPSLRGARTLTTDAFAGY